MQCSSFCFSNETDCKKQSINPRTFTTRIIDESQVRLCVKLALLCCNRLSSRASSGSRIFLVRNVLLLSRINEHTLRGRCIVLTSCSTCRRAPRINEQPFERASRVSRRWYFLRHSTESILTIQIEFQYVLRSHHRFRCDPSLYLRNLCLSVCLSVCLSLSLFFFLVQYNSKSRRIEEKRREARGRSTVCATATSTSWRRFENHLQNRLIWLSRIKPTSQRRLIPRVPGWNVLVPSSRSIFQEAAERTFHVRAWKRCGGERTGMQKDCERAQYCRSVAKLPSRAVRDSYPPVAALERPASKLHFYHRLEPPSPPLPQPTPPLEGHPQRTYLPGQ